MSGSDLRKKKITRSDTVWARVSKLPWRLLGYPVQAPGSALQTAEGNNSRWLQTPTGLGFSWISKSFSFLAFVLICFSKYYNYYTKYSLMLLRPTRQSNKTCFCCCSVLDCVFVPESTRLKGNWRGYFLFLAGRGDLKAWYPVRGD